MANQYINKFVKDGVTKFDLTSDTVTPETLAEGVTAHDASGASITGNMETNDMDLCITFAADSQTIPTLMFYNNHGTNSKNSSYPIIEAKIGKGIKSIGGGVFQGSGIEQVTIGADVETIAQDSWSSFGAFFWCTSLTKIIINKPQDSITGSPWGATNATVVWTG